jgi:hypothetical protein
MYAAYAVARVELPAVAGGGVTEEEPAMMVRASAEVAACGEDSESLTVTLKEEASAVVGVPLMVPLLERVNPAGKLPEATLQV